MELIEEAGVLQVFFVWVFLQGLVLPPFWVATRRQPRCTCRRGKAPSLGRIIWATATITDSRAILRLDIGFYIGVLLGLPEKSLYKTHVL